METGISRHDGVPIKDLPWTRRYHSVVMFKGSQGALKIPAMVPRDARFSDVAVYRRGGAVEREHQTFLLDRGLNLTPTIKRTPFWEADVF